MFTSKVINSTETEVHLGLSPVFIRALMSLRGIKLSDIARERNVTRGLITQVIDGNIQSRPTKELIAKRLGLPYEVLWGPRPEREAA